MRNLEIILLAAGKGTRMCSNQSKVLHPLAGKAMIDHVLDSLRKLNPYRIHLVVGHQREQVEQHIVAYQQTTALHLPLNWVFQPQQLGTADAIKQALPCLEAASLVLIVYADVPLIQTESLARLVTQAESNSISVMTVNLPDPTGYGRIVRNQPSQIVAIVEEKEADASIRQITEVNTGILALPAEMLLQLIPRITCANAKGEFYLTDIISLAVKAKLSVQTIQPDSILEVQGVNSLVQLAELERNYQRQQATALMQAGIHIADPARFDLRGTLQHGKDVFIDANVILEGQVVLGDRVVIEPNCIIRNSFIGDACHIKANSLVEGAYLGRQCMIGPFARLRPDTRLADQVKIGNFVETKHADIGQGVKISHLAYMGDIAIGSHSNVGAGAIHCNYDGKQKHYTYVGAHSFIGANTAIIGPLNIGSHTLLAAGSVISKDVPDNHLAIAREKQRNITKLTSANHDVEEKTKPD